MSDSPSEFELSLQYVVKGNLEGIKQLRRANEAKWDSMLTAIHSYKSHQGTIIFLSAVLEHRPLLKYFAQESSAEFQSQAPGILQVMIKFQRFEIVLYLIQLHPPLAATAVDQQHGYTPLHEACLRRKPNVPFLSSLVKIKTCNINAQTSKGQTALHLIGEFSTGIEGKQAAKILLQHHIDQSITDNVGRTAAVAAINPFVREVLTFAAMTAPRVPPTVDPETKTMIDSYKSVDEFPDLPSLTADTNTKENTVAATADDEKEEEHEEEEATRSRSHSPNGVKKPPKKLSPEAAEALVSRLFEMSIKKREQWVEGALEKVFEKSKPSKKLSTEEMTEAVGRLYDSELEVRRQKAEELSSKYIKVQAPRQLGPSDIEESCNRLCRGSQEHALQMSKDLQLKYSPKREHPERKLSKDELAACAKRLHDEWIEKSQANLTTLFEEYCKAPERKFITPEQVKALGERLCKPK